MRDGVAGNSCKKLLNDPDQQNRKKNFIRVFFHTNQNFAVLGYFWWRKNEHA